jgi:hypothetical protein
MPDGAPPTLSSQIKHLLAERGLLSPSAFERAHRLEIESGERIDRIAAKLGLVSERELAAAYFFKGLPHNVKACHQITEARPRRLPASGQRPSRPLSRWRRALIAATQVSPPSA